MSLLNNLTWGDGSRPSVLPRPFDDNEQRLVNSAQGPQGQEQYQSLYDANPYRNLTYNQSGWQKFLGALGFRTSYDDFVEQAQLNAAEYDAGIASMQFQNEYNSPAAEANRMRAAGLNPDLQGIQDVAESAAPTEDPNGMPAHDSAAQAQQAWSAFQSFGQLVMASMTSGMSLYKEFIGLDLLKGQIEGQEIDNNKGIASIIDSMILENIGGLDQHSPTAVVDTIQSIADKATDDNEYDNYASLLAGYGLSPRMIRQMRPRVARRAQSILADEAVFSEFAKRNQALASMKQSQSSEYYSEGAWQDELLDIHIRTMRAGQRKLSEITQNLAKHKVSTDEAALDITDTQQSIESKRLGTLQQNDYGSLVAQNELEQLLSNTYATQFSKVLNSVKQDLVNELQVAADTGNRMARTELYYMALHDFINFDFTATLDAGWNKNGGLFGSFLPHFGVNAEAQVHLK